MISCTELIQNFRKVGGKLTCRYDSKKCVFFSENIECDIQQTDSREIAKLLWDFGAISKNFVTDIPPHKRGSNMTELLDHYKNGNQIGFTVEISVNKH
jgi:hypothetical protein